MIGRVPWAACPPLYSGSGRQAATGTQTISNARVNNCTRAGPESSGEIWTGRHAVPLRTCEIERPQASQSSEMSQRCISDPAEAQIDLDDFPARTLFVERELTSKAFGCAEVGFRIPGWSCPRLPVSCVEGAFRNGVSRRCPCHPGPLSGCRINSLFDPTGRQEANILALPTSCLVFFKETRQEYSSSSASGGERTAGSQRCSGLGCCGEESTSLA